MFDGKPHTDAASSADLTARRIDERTIEEQWMREGKLFTKSTITVSADGQERSERAQPPDAHSEPSKCVYRRVK